MKCKIIALVPCLLCFLYDQKWSSSSSGELSRTLVLFFFSSLQTFFSWSCNTTHSFGIPWTFWTCSVSSASSSFSIALLGTGVLKDPDLLLGWYIPLQNAQSQRNAGHPVCTPCLVIPSEFQIHIQSPISRPHLNILVISHFTFSLLIKLYQHLSRYAN